MHPRKSNSTVAPRQVLEAWARILAGHIPMLSIEITRECPLRCPGCYAYGEQHLGGGVTLRELSDFRGDALVNGVLALVRKHQPLHVSIVGGEPLVRHRELSCILPVLAEMEIFTLVVTSAVIPVPQEWMKLPRVRIAVSVDGLPEHHDVRRTPATYERILKNIAGCEVNIHWTITHQMLTRPGYLEEYVSFWNARPETNSIWVSGYTPQIGEQSPELLLPNDRAVLAAELPSRAKRYPKLLFNEKLAKAFLHPPKHPGDCLFAKFSANYSADLHSRAEPCVFGGSPDCSQCGCAISSGLHRIRREKVVGPLKVDHFISASINIGNFVNRFRSTTPKPPRWTTRTPPPNQPSPLVQIQSGSSE